MEPQHLSFRIDGTPASVVRARHLVVEALRRWELPTADVVDTAELVASELLTNAVQHAGTGPVTVDARRVGAVVRIEVGDSSTERPQLRHPCKDDEHGRGLGIVAALAGDYDTDLTTSGKSCWAEIPLGDDVVGSVTTSYQELS